MACDSDMHIVDLWCEDGSEERKSAQGKVLGGKTGNHLGEGSKKPTGFIWELSKGYLDNFGETSETVGNLGVPPQRREQRACRNELPLHEKDL